MYVSYSISERRSPSSEVRTPSPCGGDVGRDGTATLQRHGRGPKAGGTSVLGGTRLQRASENATLRQRRERYAYFLHWRSIFTVFFPLLMRGMSHFRWGFDKLSGQQWAPLVG